MTTLELILGSATLLLSSTTAVAGVAVALIRRRTQREANVGLNQRAELAHDRKVAPGLMELVESYRTEVAGVRTQLEEARAQRQREREEDREACEELRRQDRQRCHEEIDRVRRDLGVVAGRAKSALPPSDVTGRIELERVERRSTSSPAIVAQTEETTALEAPYDDEE